MKLFAVQSLTLLFLLACGVDEQSAVENSYEEEKTEQEEVDETDADFDERVRKAIEKKELEESLADWDKKMQAVEAAKGCLELISVASYTITAERVEVVFDGGGESCGVYSLSVQLTVTFFVSARNRRFNIIYFAGDMSGGGDRIWFEDTRSDWEQHVVVNQEMAQADIDTSEVKARVGVQFGMSGLPDHNYAISHNPLEVLIMPRDIIVREAS